MPGINKAKDSKNEQSCSNKSNDTSQKVSLRSIIMSVLEENSNADTYEADQKKLQRGFKKLITKIDGDPQELKDGKNFSFSKDEVTFIKVILTKILKEKGVISEIVNDKELNDHFSSSKIHNFIQSVIDELDKEGEDEETIKRTAFFLIDIFHLSPLRSIEHCHALIDMLEKNTYEMLPIQQIRFWLEIEELLKTEVSCRVAESAFQTQTIAMAIQVSKDSPDDIGMQDYFQCELSPEDIMEYRLRDERILDAILNDKDLKTFIKNSLEEDAEQIFNYAYSKRKNN